jgi:Family of unknown function (DUF6516)
MPNGKLRGYYWRISSFLAERSEYLDTEHSAFLFPDEDAVEIRHALEAVLVFRNGSWLRVRAALEDRGGIIEFNYAYIYYDPRGKRVFQYDDAPHHPHVSTHPHHLHRGEKPKRGKERVYEIDLPRVDFISIVEKAIKRVR